MWPETLSMRPAKLLLVLSLLLTTFFQPVNPLAREWRFYGGDQGGKRYSTLAQINRGNVARLQRAWVYRTGELDFGLETASFRASFSSTPLVVDGVMYVSTQI